VNACRIAQLAALLLVMTGLACAAGADEGKFKGPAKEPARRPNVLFILLDNVGKDWFRCYGSQEDQTPHMDRLCTTGLKFRNFYVTPVCSTSRTMLLTGRYPFRTGWHTHHDAAIYGGGYLDWNRETTFARLLRDAGYATCIVGKWQVNDLFDPKQRDALARHGFQEHCLWPEAPPGHPAHKKRYWDAWMQRDGKRIDTRGRFGPDVCADHAIDFMRRHRDKPFLLYYSAILAHIPVTTTPLSPKEDATPRAKFAGMVRYADHLVGRLVKALDELGLRDDTLVFLATDNGTDNGTDQGMEQSLGGRIHGRISGEGIYSLSERGINVPFIVNCPGRVPAGRESDALLNAADILPTLVDLAGAKLPKGVTIDGQSFAPLLRGEPEKTWKRPWTFTQYNTRRVVRDQRFKLFSTGEFYDLAADPLERHDLTRRDGGLDGEAAAAHERLKSVLASLPADAKWPWTFRSISARKIRAAEDAARRAEWVKRDHEPPAELKEFFHPPAEYRGKFGKFRSPLEFAGGGRVKTPEDWKRRRAEILETWQKILGPWPALIEKPRVETVKITRRGTITQRQVRLGIALSGEMVDGFLLVPDGDGPFPAVVVVYYDAQTGAGLGTELRDFGWQLARRGFVTLSIGMPSAGVNLDDPKKIPGNRAPYFGPLGKPVRVQPLSALAYAAANAHTVLARRPEVYPDRIGIVGHSFGGKWALFASCLYEKFACAVWSDPGIVFDERDRRKLKLSGNVNYWDEWYLGFPLGKKAERRERYDFRPVPGPDRPRTGAYKKLIEGGHDLIELHALMAPRPFLVSGGNTDRAERWAALNHSVAINRLLGYRHRVAMTNRTTHTPTAESNEQVYRFFEWWLGEKAGGE
jgi:arylsulfatase A-like enzyme/dienelactone hydrolase